MEPEVTLNSTVRTDIHPCYEIDTFHDTMKNTVSIICILLFIFLALLSVIATHGNLLIIISIIYFKQLHTPTNYLILSLAVVDLLVGIIVFPFSIAFSPVACWNIDYLLCRVRGIFDVSLTQCSILNLGCISIDRYYAVCQPLTYRTKINRGVVVIMILVSWGISALTGIGLIIQLSDSGKCDEICVSFAVALTIYLPVFIMIFVFCIYLKIFLVAHRQARSIQNTTCQSTKSGATVSKMERKATKTLSIVLGCFLLTWLPYFICASILTNPDPLYETVIWLTMSNSVLNPFIYALFYSWFRSAFRMIISGKIFQGDFTHTQLH